ncbi:MAG: ankyrin repeat domain-containing protein [Marmoricola sp.]
MDDVDRAGRSKLHYAAVDGDLELARELIAQGFDVNLREARDFTPLHFAAQSQAVEIVELLIDNGAEIDAQNSVGATPLLVALLNFRNDPRTVRLLRDRGANPLLKNQAGISPQEHAERVTNKDLVTVLHTNDEPNIRPF